MAQNKKTRNIAILLITTLVILGIIGIIVFIAYNAEKQGGVKLGAASYYLSSSSKTKDKPKQKRSKQNSTKTQSIASSASSSSTEDTKQVHFSDSTKKFVKGRF